MRERIHESDQEPPALPPRAPLLRQPSPSLSPGVQWADLASIQSQLQIQSQVCDNLFTRTRCVRSNRWHVCVLYYSVVSIDRIPFYFLKFSRQLSLSPRNSMTSKGRGNLNSCTSRRYKVTYCSMTAYLSLNWVMLSPHNNTGLLLLTTRTKKFIPDSTLLNVANPNLSKQFPYVGEMAAATAVVTALVIEIWLLIILKVK